MVALRALVYALAVFGALALISLIVAGVMRLTYIILHKNEKKPESGNDGRPGALSQQPGKEGGR
jgi:hypothetical protein